MCWELVKDGKQCKCWLNLDEIKKNKSQYDWRNSIDKKIGIRYKWMDDEVEEKWFIVKDYEIPHLTLIENKDEFEICTGGLCKGNCGKIFDKRTDKFIYNIGDEINNLVFIAREYRKNKRGQNLKYYQYQCLKCGNIDWIVEGDLKKNANCNVCSSRKTLKGVNDIATTHPHLCKYFVNQDDIYNYSHGSNKKILLKCPDCGYQKEMKICNFIRQGFSCDKCGNGISYPEKYMANILVQLNIKFITQLNHTIFDWCQNFKYDFYLPDYNIIIETHGLQHYKNVGGVYKTYEKEHENDLMKYGIAKLNEFEYNKNYFVIDCRKSTLEWMKEHITETLGHIFDLSNIDWEKANLESQRSHMILACQLKRENQKLTTKEIVELVEKEIGVRYGKGTISCWLNKGNELGLCYYNGKEEMIKTNKRCGKNSPSARQIIQIDPLTKQIVFTWQYIKQATDFYSICHGGTLRHYLKGKAKSGHLYNGFLWYYADEWEQLTK